MGKKEVDWACGVFERCLERRVCRGDKRKLCAGNHDLLESRERGVWLRAWRATENRRCIRR